MSITRTFTVFVDDSLIDTVVNRTNSNEVSKERYLLKKRCDFTKIASANEKENIDPRTGHGATTHALASINRSGKKRKLQSVTSRALKKRKTTHPARTSSFVYDMFNHTETAGGSATADDVAPLVDCPPVSSLFVVPT